MAGHEPHPVAERPQLVDDRVEQLLVVSAREVRPPDRALEQDVADEGDLVRGGVDHDVAGRMAGAMADVEHALAEGQRVAVLQPAVRLAGFELRNAVLRGLIGDRLDQPAVVLVRAEDRDARSALHRRRAARMVEMAMGQPDRRQLQPEMIDGGEELLRLSARIDEHRRFRPLVPHQRTILLERRDGDQADFERGGFGHGVSLSVAGYTLRGASGNPARRRSPPLRREAG